MHLAVYFDGSCGPQNPGGTAAYGFVVKDETGETIHAQSGRVIKGPDATNNVAEFEALYQAMTYIIKHFPEASVTFHGDSTLVITQMRGESKARKGKYLPYYRKSIALAESFIVSKKWSFEWIARGFNSEADDLAQYQRY